MKKIWGKFLYAIAKMLDLVLGGLYKFIDFVIEIIYGLGKGLLSLLGLFALIFIGSTMFLAPFAIVLLAPVILILLFVFVVIPYGGKLLMAWTDYARYSTTEYLYDKSDKYILGRSEQFKTFKDYKKEYIRIEEEKERKAQEAYYRQEQERMERERQMWEERFKSWSGNFGGNFNGSFNGGSGQGGFSNFSTGFKEEYERSCDVLGLPYTSDFASIKSKYREMAKKYHPDINKAPDATERFQKINDAYGFLNEANVNKYKNLG